MNRHMKQPFFDQYLAEAKLVTTRDGIVKKDDAQIRLAQKMGEYVEVMKHEELKLKNKLLNL